MKVIINGKERDDIIKIDILNNMIDFETKTDSFYLLFSDIRGIGKRMGMRIIIKEQ